MKDVDRLLTTAFLDELERTPPAPVNKRALRDRTFEKLGLERQAPGAEWAQAVTVPRWRSLAWAAAACLVAVVAVSAAFLSTMVIAPGQVSQTSPILGTYLELDVVDASFDESNREMVFTLEAKTDMALDDAAAMTGFEWWSTISFFTETNGLSFEGGDTAALAQWKKTGENTYRCEGYPVEVDTETQLENHLYGDLDGTFNLQISSTSQVDSLGDDLTLSAENTFAIQIPPPQEDPTAPGTYFEASAADVSFDREQWAAVVTLAARTDMDLDSAAAQQLYSWYYSLYLRTPGGDADIGRYDGDSLEALAQWTQTGEDTYQSAPLTIPIPLSFQEEHGLSGAVQATLHLVVTDLTQGEESPIQFFPEIGFSVTLPDPAEYPAPAPGTYLTAMGATLPYVYYDQGLGILHLRAALDTDMALDHPHAGDYYSWEAQLSLTAPDGRQLTLTPLPDTPGENPQAQPTWSVEKSDDERSYFVNRNAEPSSSYDTFAFAITNTAHPKEPNYQEEYGLYGSLDGVLTLTCHETTADGSAKDWEVEIPFTAELPGREGSSPVSFESAQEEVYYKMLNSMDYFTTARVSFTEVLPGFDEELAYTIETNLDTSIAHQTLTRSNDPDFSQETYADGATVWEYDNQAKRGSSSGGVEKRRTLEEEWPGITERYYIDENGDPNYCYRGNPTNVSGAGECLLPQTWAFGLLPEKDLWVIEGSLEYCGRQCYDIVGTVRDSYAAQIGAGQFRMYVDQETGILLMLDAWNDQGSACSVTVTEITVDDPSICTAFDYDMSAYQGYTQGTGPSIGVIGSEDGPTVVYSAP